jgi:hypothetical protein
MYNAPARCNKEYRCSRSYASPGDDEIPFEIRIDLVKVLRKVKLLNLSVIKVYNESQKSIINISDSIFSIFRL